MTATSSGVEHLTPSDTFSDVTSISERGAGSFDAVVSGEWTVAGKPNGGYLLALLARAAVAVTGAGHPIAASAHYLQAPDPGPVAITTEVLRRGRSTTQLRACMRQDEQPCVEALLTVADLPAADAQPWEGGVPDIEPVPHERCTRLPAPDGGLVPMLEHIDLRLEPDSTGFTRGEPSGGGELRAWLGLVGESGLDPVSLLYAADALPPSTFETEFAGWVSTLEMSVYVRAIPVPGPVYIAKRTRVFDAAERMDEACHMWDGSGRVVAQSTQLAKVHRW